MAEPPAPPPGGGQLKRIYYGILAGLVVWGFIALTLFDPLQILKIGGFLSNLALGFSAFLVVYVNHVLMPRESRAPSIMQLGTLLCGVFYLGISGVVFYYMVR